MSRDSEAAETILRERGVTKPVSFGLILGTGLSVGDVLVDPVTVAYGDLPGFPPTGVSGHEGRLSIGSWDGVQVAVFSGRSHYYEAGDPRAMAVPIETLKALGGRTLIITNSAGSLNLDWHPGSLALISDHINFSGLNPLIGVGGDARFVNMSEAYDKRLRARMRQASITAGANPLKDGVYMWFSGPSFETPAEIRAAKLLGADLVGMSTVPEVILARHEDLRVVAVSAITNYGTGIHAGNPTHTDTKDIAASSSIALKRILRAFFRDELASHG